MFPISLFFFLLVFASLVISRTDCMKRDTPGWTADERQRKRLSSGGFLKFSLYGTYPDVELTDEIERMSSSFNSIPDDSLLNYS